MTARGKCFGRLFIANRGEVAQRIASTCDLLGITPVFAVSTVDRDAPYTRGRETVVIGPSALEKSYLDMEAVVQAAVLSGCAAIHPGWGFLAESPRFASLAEAHGVTFIGPSAHAMALLGRKMPAKRAMAQAGLSVIPGSDGILEGRAHARAIADEVGYPVLLKADSGGGGRGMRIARSQAEIERAYDEAHGEAAVAFGDGRLYLEKLVQGGRHIEIQILADRHGKAVHLGERDCTVQRNHQKLIEESPSVVLSDAERTRTAEAAVRAVQSIGYVGAGTVEFLLGDDGVLRFIEMNARLQVEHGVTEMLTGVDLIAEQILVAAGHWLSLSQDQVRPDGHVIECRINAEDPEDGFRPCPGRITRWQSPSCEDGTVRVDTHVESGYTVPPYYDSLLCKVLTRGASRDEAIDRMVRALGELVCEGVATTVGLHRAVLTSAQFRANSYDIHTLPGWPSGARAI